MLNTIIITGSGKIVWNNGAVGLRMLAALLARTKAMSPQPELQFQPSPTAEYDVVDKVLQVIKQSGITRFGFVGNEAYR